MKTSKYYSPLILFVPICVMALALPLLIRFKGTSNSGSDLLNMPQFFWTVLCFGIFAALVEKIIRLYSVEVNAEGLDCIKWGRRRSFPWKTVTRAEWSPLALRIFFTTGSAEVNFLIVRDREEIVNRIVTGMMEGGLASAAKLVPRLPTVADRDVR